MNLFKGSADTFVEAAATFMIRVTVLNNLKLIRFQKMVSGKLRLKILVFYYLKPIAIALCTKKG